MTIGVTKDVRTKGNMGLGSPTVHASNDHAVSRSRIHRGLQSLHYCGWHGDSFLQTTLRRVSSHLTNFAEYLNGFQSKYGLSEGKSRVVGQIEDTREMFSPETLSRDSEWGKKVIWDVHTGIHPGDSLDLSH